MEHFILTEREKIFPVPPGTGPMNSMVLFRKDARDEKIVGKR
jgi:hypothetical protein